MIFNNIPPSVFKQNTNNDGYNNVYLNMNVSNSLFTTTALIITQINALENNALTYIYIF